MRKHAFFSFVGAALLAAAVAPDAGAFSLFAGCDSTGFTNVVSKPGDKFTWDIADFTYKFASNFDSTWPNPRVKQQVRLALQAWQAANIMPYGPTYSYNRAGGSQKFGDIRSVALHEMGHVIGMTHPNQGAAANRNYRPTGATYFAVADQGNEVMRSWINDGDYNHILSHDELDAYHFMYDHAMSFTEVGATAAADITLQAYTAGASNWANGGSSATARSGDTCGGYRSTTGGISFNDSSNPKLGLKSKGINWDYKNLSGQSTSSITLRTRGTNNVNPLFVYSNDGPHRFTSYYTYSTALFFLPSEWKDDLYHVWSSPLGGPIPPGEVLHVGLEQDVWDWSTVSAEVKAPNGATSTPSLLSFHDWNNTIVVSTPAKADQVDDPLSRTALTTRGDIFVTARGIRITNSEVAGLVKDFYIGNVGGLNFKLSDLNRDWKQALLANQRIEPVEGFGERNIEPGGDFYVVLDGDPASLPQEVLEQGNFVYMPRPDLLDQDLFVVATSLSPDAEVGNYALLQTPPVTSTNIVENCSSEGGEIPDGSQNGAVFPIDVSGVDETLTKVVVRATVLHERAGDLLLVLEAPDGQQVVLSAYNGEDLSNYGTDCPAEIAGTTFDDDADLAIFQSSPPYVGTFRPEEALSKFRGLPAAAVNGQWKLRVYDSVGGNTGFLMCWCLKLYTCGGDCAETIDEVPQILQVTSSPALASPGDPVHVVVTAQDDTDLALVTANGNNLSQTGGNVWEGDIPAQLPLEFHPITVTAGDAAGNSTEDSSAGYTTAQLLHANVRDLTERMIPEATNIFTFAAAGRVLDSDDTWLIISDGSEVPLWVYAPGHTLSVGDFCLTRGALDVSGSPAILYSTASRTFGL